MGDRGQVELVMAPDESIFLYTHWGAGSLPNVVADALARGRDRWNDDEYLNRIIFSEMIQYDVLENTGYGIGLSHHDDAWRLVVVNHQEKTVSIKEVTYESVDWEKFDPGAVGWIEVQDPLSFEMFVAEYASLPA